MDTLSLSTGSGGSEGQNWSVKVPPSMRHFKFRGLAPGATYVVAVRACGVGGWGRRAAMRLSTPGREGAGAPPQGDNTAFHGGRVAECHVLHTLQ